MLYLVDLDPVGLLELFDPLLLDDRLTELAIFDNLFDFLLVETEQDILGFEVGVDDPADSVQVIQADEHLLGDHSRQMHGDLC